MTDRTSYGREALTEAWERLSIQRRAQLHIVASAAIHWNAEQVQQPDIGRTWSGRNPAVTWQTSAIWLADTSTIEIKLLKNKRSICHIKIGSAAEDWRSAALSEAAFSGLLAFDLNHSLRSTSLNIVVPRPYFESHGL